MRWTKIIAQLKAMKKDEKRSRAPIRDSTTLMRAMKDLDGPM